MTIRRTRPSSAVRQAGNPSAPHRFAAIDFETADHGRDSACAVSVVRVEGGAVVNRATHLIRPPRPWIMFEYIHGIGWDDVREQPVFAGVWPTVASLLDGADFIAAHSASFDKSVLNACCCAAGLRPPETGYLCTVKLAREVWSIFPTKLPDVCQHLSIPLKHHDAASDALACAKIVMRAAEEGFDVASLVVKPGKGRARSGRRRR